MNTETDFPPPDESQIRATAWALGQLSPEEASAFEAEMSAQPELAAYAEEMRQFSTLLAREFPADPEASRLPEASRARVASALSLTTKAPQQGGFVSRHWKWLTVTAAAASVALSLTPLPFFSAGRQVDTLAAGGPSDGFNPDGTPAEASEARSKLFASMDEVPFQTANPAGPSVSSRQDAMWASQPGAIRTSPGVPGSERLLTDLYRDAAKADSLASAALPALEELSKAPTPMRAAGSSLSLASSASAPLPQQSVSFGRGGEWSDHRFRVYRTDTERGTDFKEQLAENESYKPLPQNTFQEVTQAPLSTFSIDVDTASYANVRRFLNQGQRPPAEAVRLEELVNYFPYEEVPPQDGKPFAVKVEVTSAPWNPAHRLARVALKGKEMATTQRPPSNLVFLVDVSGSMQEPNKLPLVQQSLRLLTERLTENDHVSLVTYAGSSGVVLPSTNGQDKLRIQAAIDGLQGGGSTNGAGGITAAYQQAAQHFIKDGVNRVILATDGDFNVGATSHESLLALIQEKARTGVFLSVLGYGRGNLKDDTMELLADKGNGNYGYIDSLSEARKTLVEQMSGTLVTIAKDVKIQIEFNPAAVKSYRLLGYENRLLAKEDFNDDKKDAGEIGAGHNVTALYEIIPAGVPDAAPLPVVDGLKYQQVPAVSLPKTEPTPAALTGELMNVKLRWKQPQGDTSELLEVPVKANSHTPLDQAGQETRWAAAVAGFAQLLRGGDTPSLTWDMVRQLARSSKGPDPLGYRGEFLQLIDKAESLSR